MLLKSLVEDANGPAVSYLGLFLQDDAGLMGKNMSTVAGQLMAKWYDQSELAGPPRRPQSSFTETMPTLEVLTVVDNQLKILSLN